MLRTWSAPPLPSTSLNDLLPLAVWVLCFHGSPLWLSPPHGNRCSFLNNGRVILTAAGQGAAHSLHLGITFSRIHLSCKRHTQLPRSPSPPPGERVRSSTKSCPGVSLSPLRLTSAASLPQHWRLPKGQPVREAVKDTPPPRQHCKWPWTLNSTARQARTSILQSSEES